jgi:peroxiredoxin
MNKKFFLISVSAIIIISITWILLTPSIFPINVDDAGTTAVHKGFQAPEFTLESVTGDSVSLANYDGQPVLVFFWASWCSVCKRTMPGLQSVYNVYAPLGFEILAINTTYQDTLSGASNYFTNQGYSYPMLLDRSGNISQTYRLNAVPLSVLINPDGDIFDVIIGSGMSEGYLRAYLEDVFPEGD